MKIWCLTFNNNMLTFNMKMKYLKNTNKKAPTHGFNTPYLYGTFLKINAMMILTYVQTSHIILQKTPNTATTVKKLLNNLIISSLCFNTHTGYGTAPTVTHNNLFYNVSHVLIKECSKYREDLVQRPMSPITHVYKNKTVQPCFDSA